MDLKNYLIDTETKKADFARSLDVSPALLHQWIEKIRPVAIQHCPAIERSTSGMVTRQELRPEDWHLIWPELATQSAAIPITTTVRDINPTAEAP